MSDPGIIKTKELADKRRASLAKARAVRDANRAARKITDIDTRGTDAPPRVEVREAVRDPQPPRNARPGSVTAVGRDGEVLTRSPGAGGDPFDQYTAPPGWTYQWNPVHVLGSPDIVRDIESRNRSQGWRPVPASRYPEAGFKGDIVRGTVRLEERPLALTVAARNEEIRDARQQMSDQNQSLKLAGVNRSLPEGMAPLQGAQRRTLRTGGDNVRMSIDASLEDQIPRPSHQVAGSDE